MGYFNFAYKLMRMFSMLGFFYRRHKKLCKILVIILLALLTFHYLSVNGYCAQEDTTYTTDTTYFILERYQSLINSFVLAFDKSYGVDQTSTTIFNELFESIQDGNFPYFYQNTLEANIRIPTYSVSTSKTLVNTTLIYNDNTRVPCTAYNMTIYEGNRVPFIRFSSGDRYTLGKIDITSDQNYAVPYMLIYRVPIEVIECMERAGYTYENNQDIIDIKELIQESNDNLEDINESLQDMTNEEVEEGVVDIPQININDPTENGFNNIYTAVINYLGFDYATNHTYWTFSIPFINKNITYMARSYACSFQSKWLGCCCYIC